MNSDIKFKRRFRGYDRKQVDEAIIDLGAMVEEEKSKYIALDQEFATLKQEHESLLQRSVIFEKTNEEIARLALKEASDLIEKAKRNADLILKESLEYVRSLNGEISEFKEQAKTFRNSIEHMSREMLQMIDDSEVYHLIKDENNDYQYLDEE